MAQETLTERTQTPRAATGRSGRPKVACPVCSSRDRIDKVSNVVRSGRGRLIWQDGEVAHYETELSELLSEPPPPRDVRIYKAALEAVPPLFVLGAILAVLSLIQAQGYVDVSPRAIEISRNISLAWFGLLIPGVLILRYAQARIDLRKETPAWVQARRRWTALYYCSRDDIVFAPSLNYVASPAEMRHLLYPAPVQTAQALHEIPANAGLRGAK